jgi:hypothetical protein
LCRRTAELEPDMDTKTRKRLRRLLEAEKRLNSIPRDRRHTLILIFLWILLMRGCS